MDSTNRIRPLNHDQFNRSLRLKANVMGYSLNQRGLFAGVIRNPSDRRQKLDGGRAIPFACDLLALKYLKALSLLRKLSERYWTSLVGLMQPIPLISISTA